MKFIKIYILFLGFFWIVYSAQAQQRPQFSQYMTNNFLFNPAATGAYDYLDFRLGFRNQWSGFEGAPRTVFLSGQGRLGSHPKAKGPLPTIGTIDYGNFKTKRNKITNEEEPRGNQRIKQAVGGLLFYDETGPISRWMLYGSYAVHVPIKDELYFSLGVHGGLLRHGLDENKLVSDPFNPTVIDPALTGGNLASIVPDLALGLMVYKMGADREKPGYYVGFAMNQLLQSKLSFSDVEENKLQLHYFITGGYQYPISDKVDIIPSIAIKFLKGAPVSYQLNARAAFQLGDKNNLWVGSGYSNEGTFPFLAGIGISKFLDLNFSYDLVSTSLNKYTKNILPANIVNTQTYEISLGLRLRDTREVIRHNLF